MTNSIRYIILIIAIGFINLSHANEWPKAEKAAAILGCKTSIFENAERYFLESRGTDTLPDDFREQLSPAIKPILDSCDCVFDEFEKVWDYDYFYNNLAEHDSMIEQFTTGPCKIE